MNNSYIFKFKNKKSKVDSYIYIKRFIDKFTSLVFLILLSPIFLLTSIIIFFQFGHPIFFCQKRPGFKGKIFTIYKFTSMTNKNNSKGELLHDKYRLNKFGKLLRRISLDEIPELVNILKGEMSFVGPRPLKYDLSYYDNFQIKRFNAIPGITGWAQINGRNDISWEDKFKYDIWYIENISFILDLKILFKTIWKVMLCKNINPKGKDYTEDFIPKSRY